MASLVDIARAMEKDKASQQQTSAAPSKPALSLVDIAKDQQQNSQANAPAKPLTLMDVARKTEAVQSMNETAVSLQSLAADINQEERQKIDKAITKIASEVKQEQAQQRASVLQAAASEVRREEAVAESRQPKVVKDKELPIQTTPPRSTQPAPKAVPVEAVDEGGYSSFEDDDDAEDKKAVKMQKKPAKTRRKAGEELDNQSDSGSSDETQKTTPSDAPQAKEFLRAIYRGNLRHVREMMGDDGMDANTADQHGWSALHWAASQGQTEILNYLLEDKSAQVNAVEHMSGWSPLHVAVTRDNLPCVKKLLGAGANLKIRDNYGDTVYDILKALKGKKKERLLQLLDQYRLT